MHLFIGELGKKFNSRSIAVTAENKEKYISFNVKVVIGEYKTPLIKLITRDLQFIDCFRFLASSLDSLAKNLVGMGVLDNLRVSRMEEQFRLLNRKRVYPYEHMDDWEKFKENHLPPIKAFYSKLNLLAISEHDYSHAQSVWNAFGMKNLGDYHDLYLETDVLLLCNVLKVSGRLA